MIRALRPLAALVVLAITACENAAPKVTDADAAPVAVAFRVDLEGETGPLLDEDGTAALELAREGADEAILLPFENGRLAVHPLEPGRYEITHLGPLQCRGLAFEVADRPRYLGTLRARVVRTDYHVALMQPAAASPADAALLAERAGADAGAVDDRLLAVTEAAPCFLGRDGPVATWEDLTLGEKIMLSVGVAGLCAISLVSGGFCQF